MAKKIKKFKNKNQNIKVYTYKCGHNNIRLTVEKVELDKKSGILDSIFFYRCEFCNKDYEDANIQACPQCNRPLTKINLKKCPACGVKNNPAKETCWVCGAPFPKLPERLDKEIQLLLTLKVNENYYRNTDKLLGLGMRKLFDDLVASNFRKETMDAWIKKYETESEFTKQSVKEECKYISRESRNKSLLNVVSFILIIIVILMIAYVFWAK